MEDNFNGAVSIAFDPWAFGERRERASGARSFKPVTDRAISGVELGAVLSEERSGQCENDEQTGKHDDEGKLTLRVWRAGANGSWRLLCFDC